MAGRGEEDKRERRRRASHALRTRPLENDDRIYTDEQREFLMAIDRARTRLDGAYLTWPQALAVAKSLGYRKVQDPTCSGG